MPSVLPASPTADAPAAAAATDHELAQHRQVQAAVWACYAGDALLLAGFWAKGAVSGWLPVLYLLAGTLVCGASMLLYASRAWRPQFAEPLVATNVCLATGLQLAVAVLAPQVGMLAMLTVVAVVATSSLRLPARWLRPTIVFAGVAMAIAMTFDGLTLAAPASSLAERALTALWCLWTLTKCALVNIAGTALRMQLAQALARLETLATHDELTGIANRRHILELLEIERERMARTGLPFGIALLDIDHFKQINDTHGHPAGDAVLRAMGRLLREALRTVDRPGRFGGEEFLVLLHGPLDAAGAARVGERLRAAVQGHDWATVLAALQVTASIGVVVSRPGEAVEALVERADRLLYECKRGGRNQARVG